MKIPGYIGKLKNSLLHLHEDAATSVNGILAQRGSGKSNLAGVLQEELYRAGTQFVVIDPRSAHTGIRNAVDENGNPAGPSGCDVLIVGGAGADIPFVAHSGRQLAQVLMETKLSCVIDIREALPRERKEFLTDFGGELYRHNRTPMHLILEEADEIIPQQPDNREEQAIRHVWRQIVKGGRAPSGLGISIISQRPAMVDKTCLYQCDNLFVLACAGPADLDAIEAWFKRRVTDKDTLREVINSLPELDRGEAWFLSPREYRLFSRLSIRKRVTFHAGRTPKKGETLADVKRPALGDVADRVKALIEAKGGEASTSDEKSARELAALRARIIELERNPVLSAEEQADAVERSVAAERERWAKAMQEIAGNAAQQAEVVQGVERELVRVAHLLESVHAVLAGCGKFAQEYSAADVSHAHRIHLHPNVAAVAVPERRAVGVVNQLSRVAVAKADAVKAEVQQTISNVTTMYAVKADHKAAARGELNVLKAIAAYGTRGLDREAITVITGYKRSSRDQYLRRLAASRFIEAGGDGVIATPAGIKALGAAYEPPLTGRALRERCQARLSGGERVIFDLVIAAGGTVITRDQISHSTGYKRSSRDQYLRRLFAKKLVTFSGEGVRAARELFA